MNAYDKAVNNETVKEPYGTLSEMTFTSGKYGSGKTSNYIERETNMVQGNKDKTYVIKSGGRFKIGVGEVKGGDRMNVPGKRSFGAIRIHGATGLSIGCITSHSDEYRPVHTKRGHNEAIREGEFVDEFNNLKKQGHGRTYIRIPKDPEYDNVSDLYEGNSIKSEYAGHLPEYDYNSGNTRGLVGTQSSEVSTDNTNETYSNSTSTNYPSEVSHNGEFSTESSVPTNIDYRALSPYSTIYEVEDIIKGMNEPNDEIPMAQTYDMNGNPL